MRATLDPVTFNDVQNRKWGRDGGRSNGQGMAYISPQLETILVVNDDSDQYFKSKPKSGSC